MITGTVTNRETSLEKTKDNNDNTSVFTPRKKYVHNKTCLILPLRKSLNLSSVFNVIPANKKTMACEKNK